MKKILALLTAFSMIFCTISVSATENYSTEEVVNILVPYDDNHLITRNEAIIALSRTIGINDDVMMRGGDFIIHDVKSYDDINFYSLKGRTLYEMTNCFGEYLVPTRKQDYYLYRYFYGEYPAMLSDVLSWMLCVAYTEPDYYNWRESMEQDNSGFADEDYIHLYQFAVNAGFMDDAEERQDIWRIDEDGIVHINTALNAKQFKKYLKRFLDYQVYKYWDYEKRQLLNNTESDTKTITYKDIFINTYRDKVVFIKQDGIFLRNVKIGDLIYDNSGTLMLPIRTLAEILGFQNVEWNGQIQEVTLSNYKWIENNSYLLRFTNNSNKYELIGSTFKPIEFGETAKIIDDSMYIPMESVLDSFMYDVLYHKN